MRPDDQPRPDLDTAVDAVVPALTDVSHEAVTDSLRRTRVALADARGGAGALTWRWRAAGAVALIVVLVAIAVWRRPQTAVEMTSAPRPTAPVAATPPPEGAPVAVRSLPPAGAAARIARSAAAPRRTPPLPERVRATSGPAPELVPPADPLSSLVAAVQAIPEDAWARGTAAPEVTAAPIAIAPLETPPITDAPPEPAAPGEP